MVSRVLELLGIRPSRTNVHTNQGNTPKPLEKVGGILLYKSPKVGLKHDRPLYTTVYCSIKLFNSPLRYSENRTATATTEI